MEIRKADSACCDGILVVCGLTLRCAAYGTEDCTEAFLFVDGFPVFYARPQPDSTWRLKPLLRLFWAPHPDAFDCSELVSLSLCSLLELFGAWLSKSAQGVPGFAMRFLLWEENAFSAMLRALRGAESRPLFLAVLEAVQSVCGEEQSTRELLEGSVRLCGFSTVNAFGYECLLGETRRQGKDAKGFVPNALALCEIADGSKRIEVLERCGRGEDPYAWAAFTLVRRFGALLTPEAFYRCLKRYGIAKAREASSIRDVWLTKAILQRIHVKECASCS